MMNKQQLHILRHALGLTYRPRHDRNHFAAPPVTEDFDVCEQLVAAGLMRKGRITNSGLVYFHATVKGERAVHA